MASLVVSARCKWQNMLLFKLKQCVMKKFKLLPHAWQSAGWGVVGGGIALFALFSFSRNRLCCVFCEYTVDFRLCFEDYRLFNYSFFPGGV